MRLVWPLEQEQLRSSSGWDVGSPHNGGRCQALLLCSPERDEPVCEMPFFLAASTRGGTWVAEDLPTHLHVFEYIVRGTLLKWWNSILDQPTEPAPHEEGAP